MKCFFRVLIFVLLHFLLLFQESIAAPNLTTIMGPVNVRDFNIPYHAITQDKQGFIYLAGPTSSAQGVTPKVYDTTFNGGPSDIFVAKIDPQTLDPVAVTLLGGSGEERCRDILVNEQGKIVLTGSTNSPDFELKNTPITTGVIDGQTIFVVQFDGDLENLTAMKILGPGKGFALAESTDGSLYVAGEVSANFPVPPKPGWDTKYNGGDNDAFVAKLDEGLSLMSMTFVGGSGSELALSMATFSAGDVVVAGFTDSGDFPVSDKTLNYAPDDRGGNGFIVRFSSNLQTLQAASKLGGNGHDVIHDLALGRDESIYVTGLTLSSDFPVTPGSYDESYNGDADIFISQISDDLTKMIASSYIGGSQRDWGFSVALDEEQNVYVAGDTHSGDFPGVTGDKQERIKEGNGDIISSKMNENLTSLAETFFVGSQFNERVPATLVGLNRKIILSGWTNSKDFPQSKSAGNLQGNDKYSLFMVLIEDTAVPGQQ